ncbi:MAG: response regulator transcription factor [Bacteroidales bacterium]|nr:response regulator transcription factor [Bacteroidales bacterium]
MKVVIIEDEQHNCKMLIGMINNLRPDWVVQVCLESVKQSIEWFSNNEHPDLIFMDIQLTDGICFSIFDKVDLESMIIFTTAYDEYAIQAFKVNSIDYLLKPMSEEKLSGAIKKAEKVISYIENEDKEKPDYDSLLQALKTGTKNYRKRFLIAGVSSFFKIETENIAYFYTINRITFAVTFQAKEHIVDLTMEKLEEQVDPEIFFRANRSQIINIESIQKFESYFGGKLSVRLVHPFKENVIISRLKATEFKNWLNDNY